MHYNWIWKNHKIFYYDWVEIPGFFYDFESCWYKQVNIIKHFYDRITCNVILLSCSSFNYCNHNKRSRCAHDKKYLDIYLSFLRMSPLQMLTSTRSNNATSNDMKIKNLYIWKSVNLIFSDCSLTAILWQAPCPGNKQIKQNKLLYTSKCILKCTSSFLSHTLPYTNLSIYVIQLLLPFAQPSWLITKLHKVCELDSMQLELEAMPCLPQFPTSQLNSSEHTHSKYQYCSHSPPTDP